VLPCKHIEASQIKGILTPALSFIALCENTLCRPTADPSPGKMMYPNNRYSKTVKSNVHGSATIPRSAINWAGMNIKVINLLFNGSILLFIELT
jgi:hypothetical protein